MQHKQLFRMGLIAACFSIATANAQQGLVEPEPGPLDFFQHLFKGKEMDVFPVPIWESRPDKGNSYGAMPVMLLSDNQTKAITSIFAVLGQYNSITQVDGAVIANLYPEADREVLFYGGASARYQREVSIRFFDPHIFQHFYMEYNLVYLKSPFGHFYGLGPDRMEANRSNYTSRNFKADLKTGYYLTKRLRANYGLNFHTTDLLNRAMEDFDDMLRRYGGLAQVVDSSNLIQEVSLAFDSRKLREYSKRGFFAELGYFVSNQNLGSDESFQGFSLKMIKLIPLWQDRLVTAFRFNLKQVYGTAVPFYELSSIGGPFEMRAFTPDRFIDKGKMVFQLEERFRLIKSALLGIPFEIYVDPFVEFGSVYNSINTLERKDWQVNGGLGIRAFVPPNVIGRVDMTVGADGFEIYTALGYPF